MNVNGTAIGLTLLGFVFSLCAGFTFVFAWKSHTLSIAPSAASVTTPGPSSLDFTPRSGGIAPYEVSGGGASVIMWHGDQGPRVMVIRHGLRGGGIPGVLIGFEANGAGRRIRYRVRQELVTNTGGEVEEGWFDGADLGPIGSTAESSTR